VYRSNFSKAIIILTCAVAFFGCKQKTEFKENGKVLAEVNGSKITSGDFNREVESLPPQIKVMATSADGQKQLLDTMVVRQLLMDQAHKEGIDKSTEVVQKVDDLKKRVIIDEFLKKKATVSEQELRQFYEQNKDKMKTGPQVRASHILVKSEKEAQDILAQLKQGADFAALAKKHSSDPAAAAGGDLGWFSKETMVPAFANAAFALKEGETSGIVKTDFGYHIIKSTGKRPAGVRPYEDVKEQIRAYLLPTKQQEIFQKLKEELKKNAKISIKDDALKTIGEKGATLPSGHP